MIETTEGIRYHSIEKFIPKPNQRFNTGYGPGQPSGGGGTGPGPGVVDLDSEGVTADTTSTSRPVLESPNTGYVVFPSLSNRFGDILIWDDKSRLGKEGENYTMRFTNDNRGRGTSIWGMLFIVGIIVFGIGAGYNPFDSFKSKLVEEGKALQKEQFNELDKILKGRTFEELSSEEKQKYDQTFCFYTEAQNAIFEVLTGNSKEKTS